MISNNKSILNAPKHKFLKPHLKPTPFSLQEEDINNEDQINELKLNELNLSSDSSISSTEEIKNTNIQETIIKPKKQNKAKLSGNSLDTKGTSDSFSL